MPNLEESLEGKDLGTLSIAAECWGLELEGKNARERMLSLKRQILNKELVAEIADALPREAKEAISRVSENGGRMAWGQFEREFGNIRDLGPAQRDKKQPQRNPESTGEILWYRGIIGRAFFDSEDGPREYAYIPDDLLALIPSVSVGRESVFGRPARPAERKNILLASDHILEASVSYLAGLRMLMSEEELTAALAQGNEEVLDQKLMRGLLTSAGVLDSQGKAQSNAVQKFLTAKKGATLKTLVAAWQDSREFNEVRMLPGLRAEGEWENNAIQTRKSLLELMRKSAGKNWWSISALIEDVKARFPDFQRKGGEYDSWYFKDEESGEFLRGFEHWDQVEGRLIHFFIRGPLHWLGIVELGFGEKHGMASAFRFSDWADALLDDSKDFELEKEAGQITVDSQGQIQVPAGFQRAIRYQIARFCEWQGRKKGSYRYQIRAQSLEKAKAQGLEAGQLLGLIQKHANSKIPPNLIQALKSWEEQGTMVKAGEMLVLRVRSEKVMKALLASRGKRYLGEVLGPYAVEIKPGARHNLLQILTELGYLGEIDSDGEA